jgi:CheY-like chemotaxis protein
VKSKIDKGSDFCFNLSFKKTDAQAETESIAEHPYAEIKNVKVLVVEDIALNQLLMRTLLDDFGFKCDIASNGKIALEKLQENTYDIILMDLQMPEMNGFEATEFIRKKLKLKIPIIALTADVTTSDLAKCKAVGMDDYISKPVDERLLESKIIQFLTKVTLEKKNIPEDNNSADNKKYINLQFLTKRTKADPQLIREMITLYIGQTTSLIKEMLESAKSKDWKALQAIAHKMIPSFSIVGMNAVYEGMAIKLQEYARNEEKPDEIQYLVSKLDLVLTMACKELQVELDAINNRDI